MWTMGSFISLYINTSLLCNHVGCHATNSVLKSSKRSLNCPSFRNSLGTTSEYWTSDGISTCFRGTRTIAEKCIRLDALFVLTLLCPMIWKYLLSRLEWKRSRYRSAPWALRDPTLCMSAPSEENMVQDRQLQHLNSILSHIWRSIWKADLWHLYDSLAPYKSQSKFKEYLSYSNDASHIPKIFFWSPRSLIAFF